ncbi:MAG TPA: 30S ribosomal protein S9 [Dehalococcoidia bacterium]|nr:30S ribosomal protein S9 [Dehalococcoidia bacterium]
MEQQYYYGTGRRKTSVARVRLYAGTGAVVINGKPMDEFFVRPVHREAILRPLVVAESQDKFNAQVKVDGGGITGWAGAISHGIARALVAADENLKPVLRHNGLLTRDPREKERKKYGLKRARKAPQYTKR